MTWVDYLLLSIPFEVNVIQHNVIKFVSDQGQIQDFKLGGRGAVLLKKSCREEGGMKILGVFRVKNHDFMHPPGSARPWWLAAGQLFFPDTPVSYTNKTDRHNIAEILFKVALNTIIPFEIYAICYHLD